MEARKTEGYAHETWAKIYSMSLMSSPWLWGVVYIERQNKEGLKACFQKWRSWISNSTANRAEKGEARNARRISSIFMQIMNFLLLMTFPVHQDVFVIREKPAMQSMEHRAQMKIAEMTSRCFLIYDPLEIWLEIGREWSRVEWEMARVCFPHLLEKRSFQHQPSAAKLFMSMLPPRIAQFRWKSLRLVHALFQALQRRNFPFEYTKGGGNQGKLRIAHCENISQAHSAELIKSGRRQT